jgi:hypothetical protein
MGWEQRGQGGQQYLYRSRRVGEKVVHEYIGRGEKAKLALQELQAASAARRTEFQAMLAEQARTFEVARQMRRLHHCCDNLLEAVLLIEGFGRHNYGPWRRRRET